MNCPICLAPATEQTSENTNTKGDYHVMEDGEVAEVDASMYMCDMDDNHYFFISLTHGDE